MNEEELNREASFRGFNYVDEIVQKYPNSPWNDHDVEFGYRDGFIAGAKWMMEKLNHF